VVNPDAQWLSARADSFAVLSTANEKILTLCALCVSAVKKYSRNIE
jgi:hypothetical protein